jgi:predicted ATP-binding protein involved in virulence
MEKLMRIDYLSIKNFKNFESREFQFHPQFNLIVGMNGTGKTSLLDALSIAAGSWFLGISDANAKSRHIQSNEITLKKRSYSETDTDGIESTTTQWQRLYPCEVTASGIVTGQHINWTRGLYSDTGRTQSKAAKEIKQLSATACQNLEKGQILPLLSYYGTGRLWQEPRDNYRVSDPDKIAKKQDQTRLAGYRTSIDPRLSVTELARWIARQSWISYQKNNNNPIFKAVKAAMLNCLDDASDIDFDAELSEVVITRTADCQPFSNLSDGQRCMLALVGDIAQKAATLNPQLGSRVLQETEGVVLIDELDLHLHPKWQRRLADDLRNTFPRIQFICTTHSPFLIQAVRSSDELIMLDGQPLTSLDNKSINEIARGVQSIENPEVSQRYEAMKSSAKSYLEQLEEADELPEHQLEQFRQALSESIAPYADNPAFQAFLEMKRVAKIGE